MTSSSGNPLVTWLRVACWATVAFGAISALAAAPGTEEPWRLDRLVVHAVTRGQPVPVGPMGAGVVTWFLVDSGDSLAAGLPGNVVLNVLFLGFFSVPLLRLRGPRD